MPDVPIPALLPIPEGISNRAEQIQTVIERVAESLPKGLEARPNQFLVERVDRLFISVGFSGDESTDALNTLFGTPGDSVQKSVKSRRLTQRELQQNGLLDTLPLITIGDFSPRPEGLPLIPISGG